MTEDLGLAVVRVVRERLGVDDEWCVDHERGFTWWAHDLAQSVWAEEGFDDGGIVVWRLHARTDLVRGVPPAANAAEVLARLNAFSPLSCLALHATEPGTLQLVASAYLHEGSLGWVAPLFQLATGFQVAAAHELAGPVANALGAQRAVSAHPDRGQRLVPDEMLGLIWSLPLRESDSLFAGPELGGLARTLMEGPSTFATATRDGLTAEFPFLETTSVLSIEATERHPRLGAGVRLTLTLPRGPRARRPAEEAVELNGLEMRDFTRAHLLGGWCLTADHVPSIAFHAFFPNVAYQPGVLTNLALSMAVRADWVARQVGTSGSAGGIRELPHITLRPLRRGAGYASPTSEQLAAIGTAWRDILPSTELMDGADRHFFTEALQNTTAKWLELYEAARLDADVELVLRWMAARIEETSAGGVILDDGALSAALSMGAGGYLWRLAEREVGRGIGHPWEEVSEAIGLYEDDEALADATLRQRVLYQASARCVGLKVPLWRTSPGNLIWGYDLFNAGQQFVAERTGALEERIDPADLFYAFYFGVALFHVEAQFDSGDSPPPGAWAGPEWEHCEVVLREDVWAFVAEAEGPEGRYSAAMSGKLPRFRFSIGFLESRAYNKLHKRHEEVVSFLEATGWIRTATKGEHWWSDRFRRRSST